jgi:hypothetical protein
LDKNINTRILEGCKVDNEVDTGRDEETIRRDWARTGGQRWRGIINMHCEDNRQNEEMLVAIYRNRADQSRAKLQCVKASSLAALDHPRNGVQHTEVLRSYPIAIRR